MQNTSENELNALQIFDNFQSEILENLIGTPFRKTLGFARASKFVMRGCLKVHGSVKSRLYWLFLQSHVLLVKYQIFNWKNKALPNNWLMAFLILKLHVSLKRTLRGGQRQQLSSLWKTNRHGREKSFAYCRAVTSTSSGLTSSSSYLSFRHLKANKFRISVK